MSTSQSLKLTENEEDQSANSILDPELSESSASEDTSNAHQESSLDTDSEIVHAQRIKSKKTLKRKRRATEPSQFGATLQSLLDTNAPSSHPLSLKSSIARQRNDAKLESQARKVIRTERKEKEDKGRVRDVIGGWGGESERSLRKVAQRGVVKLFNTIQQSQLAVATAEEKARASRGTGKPSLPAPTLNGKDKGKKFRKPNVLGGGKDSAVDKDAFFDMIRSGGIVSKV